MWVFSLESTGAECGLGRVINNEHNILMCRQDEKGMGNIRFPLGPDFLRGPELYKKNCIAPLQLD